MTQQSIYDHLLPMKSGAPFKGRNCTYTLLDTVQVCQFTKSAILERKTNTVSYTIKQLFNNTRTDKQIFGRNKMKYKCKQVWLDMHILRGFRLKLAARRTSDWGDRRKLRLGCSGCPSRWAYVNCSNHIT